MVNILIPYPTTCLEDFLTVEGISWNLRSRKISAPLSTNSLRPAGPEFKKRIGPTLNVLTLTLSLSTQLLASLNSGKSRAKIIRSSGLRLSLDIFIYPRMNTDLHQ